MIKEMIAGYMTELGPFVSNQIPEIGLDTRMAAAYTTKEETCCFSYVVFGRKECKKRQNTRITEGCDCSDDRNRYRFWLNQAQKV